MILYKRYLYICSWSEHYPETEEPKNKNELFKNDIFKNQNEPLTNSITDSTTNVYIHDCSFVDCSSTTTGGVLTFSQTTGKLLIEFSFFDDCHSESYGGSVYAEYCDCVIDKICSYKCTTSSSGGQFIYTELSDSKLNYVLDSSVCSTHYIFGSGSTIFLMYGNQLCDFVNVSNYKVSSGSAIVYGNSNRLSQITHCSIISNHAVTFSCVWLNEEGNSYLIKSCNIVQNSQESDDFGIIVCHENTEINQCCIKENTATYLFYISSGFTVKLVGAYVQAEQELIYPDRGTISGSSINVPFTNSLEHIICSEFLYECHCSIHVRTCSTFVRIFRFLSVAAMYSRTK